MLASLVTVAEDWIDEALSSVVAVFMAVIACLAVLALFEWVKRALGDDAPPSSPMSDEQNVRINRGYDVGFGNRTARKHGQNRGGEPRSFR